MKNVKHTLALLFAGLLLIVVFLCTVSFPVYAKKTDAKSVIVIQSQPHDVEGYYGKGYSTGLKACYYDEKGNEKLERLRYDLYKDDEYIGRLSEYEGEIYLSVKSSGKYYIKISALTNDEVFIYSDSFNVKVTAGTRLLNLLTDTGDTFIKVVVFPALWVISFLVMFPLEIIKSLSH